MYKPYFVTAAAIAIAFAGACSTYSNRDAGQVIGAVTGGVLGSQVGGGTGRTAATIAGSLLGGYLGGYLGEQMDANDRRRTSDTLEYNATDASSSWHNPDSGYDYSVTPTRTYESAQGPCRDYTTEAWIDGRRETVTGTACRDADGSWRAASN